MTLCTGVFPRDAWIEVEFFADRCEVIEEGCFCDGEVDFAPAYEWASRCSAVSVPPAPAGWRVLSAQEADLREAEFGARELMCEWVQ